MRETIKWIGVIHFSKGTKGSNSNENVPTSRHRHKQKDTRMHTHRVFAVVRALQEYISQTLRDKTKAYVCVSDCCTISLSIYLCVCVCLRARPKMNVPLGLSSRQASKLPSNGARENSPQQEPGTANQCQ